MGATSIEKCTCDELPCYTFRMLWCLDPKRTGIVTSRLLYPRFWFFCYAKLSETIFWATGYASSAFLHQKPAQMRVNILFLKTYQQNFWNATLRGDIASNLPLRVTVKSKNRIMGTVRTPGPPRCLRNDHRSPDSSYGDSRLRSACDFAFFCYAPWIYCYFG